MAGAKHALCHDCIVQWLLIDQAMPQEEWDCRCKGMGHIGMQASAILGSTTAVSCLIFKTVQEAYLHCPLVCSLEVPREGRLICRIQLSPLAKHICLLQRIICWQPEYGVLCWC